MRGAGLRVLALGVWIAGCPDNSEPLDGHTAGDTTGSGTTGGSLTSVEPTTEPTTFASDTEVSPVVSCDCDVPAWDLASYDVAACGWGPCGSIERQGDVLDVVAVDCVLDMLIAGAPGVVHFKEGGFSGEEGFVRIGEGRQGLSRRLEYEDLGCTLGPLEIVALRPADYFSECKAMEDLRDRYACLKDWSAGRVGEPCAGAVDCGQD